MYLHRYLRYTPSLAIVILFYTAMSKFLISGPFEKNELELCETNWWANLLHVSVYVKTNKMVTKILIDCANNKILLRPKCYDISWYLAVDFELFLITPILVYPLWRWKNKFVWVLIVLVVMVQFCLFATAIKNHIMVNPDLT